MILIQLLSLQQTSEDTIDKAHNVAASNSEVCAAQVLVVLPLLHFAASVKALFAMSPCDIGTLNSDMTPSHSNSWAGLGFRKFHVIIR